MEHWHVIMNRKAGGAVGRDADSLARDLQKALSREGREVRLRQVDGPEIVDAIEEARDAAPDALLVAGGDGTISTAADRLRGSGIPLGVLPMGTMNLLARDLSLPLDPIRAAEALANPTVEAMDIAEVNGHMFISSSVLGVIPRLAIVRERLRGKPFLLRALGMFGQYLRLIGSYPLRRVMIQAPGEHTSHTTPFLTIANNPYQQVFGQLPVHDRLDRGTLALYVSPDIGRWGILGVMLGLATGLWHWDPHFQQIEARSFTITARKRKRFRVMNDGELMTLQSPLHYQIHPRDLKVLVPVPPS